MQHLLFIAILPTTFAVSNLLDTNKTRKTQLVQIGNNVKLECLGNINDIFIVKWFKNNEEFCRYFPTITEYTENTSLTEKNGRNKTICNKTSIDLGEVNETDNGIYTCYLLTGNRKEPKLVKRSMSVMVYPKEGPIITGIKAEYEEGEQILANCTAAPSNPPPSLIWYINGVVADGWSMFTYPCLMVEGDLCVLILGLRLTSTKKLFPSGVASLVCEAGILSLPPKRAYATTRMVGYNSTGISCAGHKGILGAAVLTILVLL